MTNYTTVSKTKKKNRSAILLLAILLSMVIATSVFVGTLSKYRTSNTLSDEAVVAKFGLNVPNTINLFSDSYTNVLADEAGKKIIAPGTEGQYTFEITGTSEVAYIVSAEVDVTYSDEWDDYAPLRFSVNGTDWTDFATFKTNLTNALASSTMAPNTLYENAQTIYWQWPFSVSEENDLKDTNMGNLAAEGTAPQVSMDVKISATQVD